MSKLEQILSEIKQLEKELLEEIQQKQDEYFYIIRGKRVEFEEETRRYHKTMAKTLGRYFAEASLAHILTAPIIYFCLVPALFMDLVATIYQAICFRVYGIPRVKRDDYIAIDRHHLQYLNLMEKMNCVYCGYFNGLVAYVQEIAARTEQYWCPIKHARKLSTIHSRYHKFVEYGDGENFQQRLMRLREDYDDLSDQN